MLSGLLEPTNGDAYLLGDSIITNLDLVKQKINVSPQETAIAPNLTGYENLVFVARIYGVLGSVFNNKQTGGITSIIIQVVAFTSSMWFSLDLVGGGFKTIGYLLPFAHSVDLIKYILANDYSNILVPLLWTIGYVIVIYLASIIVF